MTAMRLIPLPIHSALEMLGGLALMGVPFVLGFTTPAAVAAVVIGVLLVGLALHAVDDTRDSLPISAHHSFDWVLALALAGASLALAAAGDSVAGSVFAAGAVVQLALNVTTRYSSAR
jgi:hypothetical protein